MIGVALIVLLVLLFGPQWWARSVLARYGQARPDLPGNGAEFANHLLSQARMNDYSVELAPANSGDHFDPISRCVRLSAAHHDGRSLTAIVVAAHEVGHAIQHRIGYRPLALRTRLAVIAMQAERVGAIILIAMPFITVISRMPAAGVLTLLSGLAIMALPVAVHLVTLPVEFDASFRRALPILRMGYLDSQDIAPARRILAACALTYLSAALASIVNFWRWVRVLRR
jgi:uncharacterized protein